MIGLDRAMIVFVEATLAVRQIGVTGSTGLIKRTGERLWLVAAVDHADGDYGNAANLAWLTEENGLEPIPMFDTRF